MAKIVHRAFVDRVLRIPVYILLFVLFCSTSLHGITIEADNSSFYVAPYGSDANEGSLNKPFKTIQKCANVVSAGESCKIRGGTYRETITPVNSGQQNLPIVFEPYNSEKVIVSGADILSGEWESETTNIYKTNAMDWTLGVGKDQIFVDGTTMIEARWPNTSLDISNPKNSFIRESDVSNFQNGDYRHLVPDENLDKPAGFWDGAKINSSFGPNWAFQTGIVTSSTENMLVADYPRPIYRVIGNYGGENRNPYYLWGIFKALDAEHEWYRDPTTNVLYFYPPSGINPQNMQLIEAKKRELGFDLSNLGHIHIKNIDLFATTVLSNPQSSNLILDGITIKYPTHFTEISENIELFGLRRRDTGLILDGSDNILQNCHISFSAGNGVSLLGRNSIVRNCLIHDVNYAGLDNAAITPIGENFLVERNTMYNSARSVLVGCNHSFTGGPKNSKFLHNTLFNAGLQTVDLGVIYLWGNFDECVDNEFAYNQIYNNFAKGHFPSNPAFYLDSLAHRQLIHHNVMWGSLKGIFMNDPGWNNKIYNNTIESSENPDLYNSNILYQFPESFGIPPNPLPPTDVRNNIFIRHLNTYGSVSTSSNALIAAPHNFIDSANYNFQLSSNSQFIDSGEIIPNITDGFLGSAPDLGAYEYGKEKWSSGKNIVLANTLSDIDVSCNKTSTNLASCQFDIAPGLNFDIVKFKISIGSGNPSTCIFASKNQIQCLNVQSLGQYNLSTIYFHYDNNEPVDSGETFYST